MFDMMKFDGDVIDQTNLNGHTIEPTEFLGVLSVRKEGESYIINNDEPTGKLLIYRAMGKDCAMYIVNSIETNCLVDLL